MDKIMIFINKQKLHILILMTFCLVFISKVAIADDASPGIPPQMMKNFHISSNSEINLQSPLSVSNPFNIFIPYIRNDRSGLTVNLLNRQDSLNFYVDQYLTSEKVEINWTGNHSACDPGTTDPNFRNAVLRRINYFRAMAGVPADITFSDESNRLAQAAAFMMSVNHQLSHTPPTNWICYSSDGAAGAGSSNLYLGVYAWNAITGYMKDPGGGNYFIGHRRWILYPQTQIMGTGDIPPVSNFSSSNALRVFDNHMWEQRPPTREEFVAWPPPGFVPYQVVFPRWSFSFAQADFSQAWVSMESNGQNISIAQANVVDGFGENTLVWIPMNMNDGDYWPRPTTDTKYGVTIHNVSFNKASRNFSYEVIIYNPIP